jgi:hypothetical protein
MRIEITKQECRWLADLVNKEKMAAELANQESPNRLFELRRDNMAELERKLNTAYDKQISKERKQRDER